MKKLIATILVILQTTFLFGQNMTYAWGPWVQNSCFKGLQSRCKVRDYNSSAKQYTWDIEIKNNYASKVSFNFDIRNSSIDGRTSINAGGIDKGWTLNPSNTNLYVEFSKVCFDPNDYCSINSNGTQNKGYKCFAECDNGVANVPKLCGDTNSNNASALQQNDLSEYNRSKADLERQMQEGNAKRQEEANRINNQSKQFIKVYNEGVDLQRRGNFKDAKDKYQQAIGLATNDTQRKQAKNAFDGMEKTTKNEAVINVIGDGLKQIGSALDKAHEEKQQKHRAEMDEHDRKRAIIDEDKAINTLTDPKIFETYADYVAKNLENLNYKFEKIASFSNIPNKSKSAMLNFKGITVIITNQWDGSSMSKSIYFKTESEKLYGTFKKSAFFESLKQLYPFYDNFSEKVNSFDYTNCIVFGLEKTQPFIEVYNNGYQSATYKGFVKILNEFEKTIKQKLAKTDNSVEGLLEKAQLYSSGNNGVEKNYQKALELYQQAFDKSKDKEILLRIGHLHKENSNENKAIESFENYIVNNDNINPIVYSNLGWIYDNVNSPYYDVEKAKINYEKEISILEANYTTETNENKKLELKKRIANGYSRLAFLYDYHGKNVVPQFSIVYYEKAMQWDENNTRTAYSLMKLYAKDWDKTDNFKRDTKKAKFWALKICEIADRLEEQNKESFEAKIARMDCTTVKDHLKNNFKYLKK